MVLNSPQPSVSSRELLQFPGAFKFIFSTTQDIGTLLMVILTAFVIGGEYRWGTVRQMMVCVGSRFQYLGAKIISLLIIIILISFISLIMGTIFASFTTSALGDLNLDFITLSLMGEIGRMFGGTVLALATFALLTLLFALLSRSAWAGLGGCLGYIITEAIIVDISFTTEGWLKNVPEYLIRPNASGFLYIKGIEELRSYGDLDTGVSIPHAALVLALWCVLLCGLSFYLFKQRDITTA